MSIRAVAVSSQAASLPGPSSIAVPSPVVPPRVAARAACRRARARAVSVAAGGALCVLLAACDRHGADDASPDAELSASAPAPADASSSDAAAAQPLPASADIIRSPAQPSGLAARTNGPSDASDPALPAAASGPLAPPVVHTAN